MFKRMKRFTREGGVAQILMEAHGLTRDQAFSFIELGKVSGFTQILDADNLNNHERVSILLKSFEETANSLETEEDEGHGYETWEEWYAEYKEAAASTNPQLAVNNEGSSLLDFMDHGPLRRAFEDGVCPEELGEEFGEDFDLATFGR